MDRSSRAVGRQATIEQRLVELADLRRTLAQRHALTETAVRQARQAALVAQARANEAAASAARARRSLELSPGAPVPGVVR